MKLSILSSLFLVSLILILSGCGVKPKPKDEAVIDPTLPEITLTQSGTQSTMKSIALEWNVIADKRVRGIYVYKKTVDSNDTDKKNFLDTIDNRFSTHFLDDDLDPDSKYIYYFKTYSDKAESLKSKEYIAKTKVIFDSVSWIYAKGDMPRSAKIIWRPHKSKAVNAYIIQRKSLEDEAFKNIDKVYGRLNVEYIDTDLKDKHTYSYRIRAVTFENIISKESDVVIVNTKALPLEVTNITATTNLAKKITVKWDKTKSPDFSHYNVYRSKDADSGYKLRAQLHLNSYTDKIEEDGAKYFYRVSVIDMDKLESNHQVNSALGMTLVRPASPSLIEASLIENKIVLKWTNTDERTKSYKIIKKYKVGLFDFKEDHIGGIIDTNFVDADILPNTTYSYQVLAIDKNAISSKPSIVVKLETKEIKSAKTQEKKPQVEEVKETKVQEVQEIQIEKEDIEDIEEIQVENI